MVRDLDDKIHCSIGVMAYNEEANIGALLDSLLSQETHSVEIDTIVVVASGCTDNTEDIVSVFAVRDPRVKLLRQAQREGKASAVNLFLRNVSSEVIVLQSADTLPVPYAIEALVSPFIDGTIGMVGGHPVPTNPTDNLMGFGVHMLWNLHHQVSLQRPKMGELIAFRNVFRQIPYDTAVDEASIEPLIVGQGMRLHYAPQAIVLNRGPETVRDFFMQRRRIFTGHLYVKESLGYQVSTMNGLLIAWLFLRSFKLEPRYLLWSPVIIWMEVLVRLLARYDYYILKRNPFTWAMVESTKNLSEAPKIFAHHDE